MKSGLPTAQIGAEGPSPTSDHEKINFYGRIAIFMKLCAHAQMGADGVPELRSWENQFLRPNRNFYENCDSARLKIDFLMIWARGRLLRRFGPWQPNFMKIAIRP